MSSITYCSNRSKIMMTVHDVVAVKCVYDVVAVISLTINGLYDSSASRAYYAAYLAAWHHLLNIGIQPGHKTQKGDYYWRHHLFPDLLSHEYKLIGPLQMEKFELLYSHRIKADYYIDEVEKEEADNSIQIASDFVSFFLDNKGNPE